MLQKSFEVGADDYLTKPINATNLKIRIKNIFMSAYKDTLILNQNRLLAVNETVQMLAHQWRQPLTAIGAASMDIDISYQLNELSEERLTGLLSNINTSLQSLSTTLDEFMQLSKIELNPSFNNINETILTSINLVKDRFEINGIIVHPNLTQVKSISYFPNEIIKILANIFTNTIEAFAKDKTKLQRLLKISTKQTDQVTTITMVDNAGGIKANILNKIFEPYTSTKADKNSVGLGLYNAFNILKESMNASIELTSKNDMTTVIIELPTIYENK